MREHPTFKEYMYLINSISEDFLLSKDYYKNFPDPRETKWISPELKIVYNLDLVVHSHSE